MNLDDAYAVPPYIPGAEEYPPRWAEDARAFRARLSLAGRARLGLMYGHGSRETLDMFRPQGPSKGLFVFVHGGFWRKYDNSSWSHFAQGAVDRGYTAALPSYDLAPRVHIRDITRQVAQAVTVSAHDVEGPIYLSGHSAGGHLVARMLEPDLLAEDVRARIARVMPISPLSDLRPLMRTQMNDDFQMDEAEAEAESPILQPPPDKPVTVWVGGAERPAFLDQARWLQEAWNCDLAIEPGKHHFDVIDGLRDPESPMMQTLFAA